MPSKIVAVAGGTGQLGRAIVEELVSHGGYTVFILGREVKPPASQVYTRSLSQANAEKAKELGAEILAIDYNDTDSIASILEKNNVDTVISTLGVRFGNDPELALIQGSAKSNVTKRYIPSSWGIRYTPEYASNPLHKFPADQHDLSGSQLSFP